MFEIGNSLREARERRRIDFPEAEQQTKIRAKYLRALEDEQFDQLPAQTYIKGFVRTYADYLGLDGQLYVDEYNSRYASGDEVLERHVRRVRPRRRRERRLETHMVWLALVLIGLVTALVVVAWRSASGGATASVPVARPESSRPVIVAPRVRAYRGDSRLDIRYGSGSGKAYFANTLERGHVLPLPAKRMWLSIASPENLEVRVDGRWVRFGRSKPCVVIVTPQRLFAADIDSC